MHYRATITSKDYNPSLPQTQTSGTPVQIGSVARGLAIAVGAAFKSPAIREEYNRWLEEQKGKENNVSNNN